MPTPQSAILPEANAHALFITLLLKDGPLYVETARRALAACPGLTAEVGEIDPGAGLRSAVGIGSLAWSRVYPGARPGLLKPFTARRGAGGEAPSTPADLLLHIRADREDLCFELARRMRRAFADAVYPAEEVHGFRYLDSRDLTGFVDGTENPEGDERAEVALVGDEDPDFAGGSYVSMQRYLHDLTSWETLPETEQERVIGRTKADDRELPEATKPATAHIARVVIEEDGEELEILRHSMPYGGSEEAGLVFIAYARTPAHFDRMLARMMEADRDGDYDHLMNYTRAVTGASFFVPATGFLVGGA